MRRMMHRTMRNASFWRVVCALGLLISGCAETSPPSPSDGMSVADGELPPNCRPVTQTKAAEDPVRLPCSKTIEECDGLDNDGDGIVDPHCPTPCTSTADCTSDGVVQDAACVASTDPALSVTGVCGSIHTIPTQGDHALCWGVLCPPTQQCVEGSCVDGGTSSPGAPCTSGALCPVTAGCVVGPGAVLGELYEVGQCEFHCFNGTCLPGYLCVTAPATASFGNDLCTHRYACEGSVEECESAYVSCLDDPACASILQCVESLVNEAPDANPYEPIFTLLGFPDSPLAACWDALPDNSEGATLLACLESVCAACFNCTDKVCGDDGCGGTCGLCPDGTLCTDYLRSDQLTTQSPGQCVCLPTCIDRDCGDDGCGGSCGVCEQDNTVCSDDGKCVCWPTCEGRECGVDGCDVPCGFCDDGETCTPEGQCLCIPNCEGKTCGHDGCDGSCGTCDEPNMVCDNALGHCVCFPTCEGKSCGVDGCGNSCGECSAGTSCGAEGLCGCFPSCEGKVCGVDGCGVSCGTCPPGQNCTPSGTCECNADCTNKECGPDGCGGSCGTCEGASVCSATGTCVTGSDGSCMGLCAVPDATPSCKCDASCFVFKDCCDDICSVCAMEFAPECAPQS